MQARSLLFVLALFAASLHTTSVHAAEPLQLSVVRSHEALDCPEKEALALKVQKLLRPSTNVRDVRVDAEFSHQEGEYQVVLRISGDQVGQRTLSDPGLTCNDLADATALTLAILLDPTMSVQAPPSKHSTIVNPPPQLLPSPPAPAPRTELSIGGILTVGLTASPALGLRAGGGLATASWRAGLDVFWLPQRAFPLAPGAVEVSLLSAIFRGCWQHSMRTLTLGFCGQTGIGRYQAEARGYSENLSPGALWIGGGAGFSVRGPLTDFLQWEINLDWIGSWRHRTFVIEGVGKAFDPSLWGGPVLGIALVWRP